MADAQAAHPTLDVVEADSEAEQRLLENLADWCDRYTPLVALDSVDGLFLDIAGCAHLFAGELSLMKDARERLFRQGFLVRAGLASTPGAAWAAARFMPGMPAIDEGREAEALKGLPIGALRLQAQERQGLESVGLRTIGAVMSAPRAPLARRFGKAVLLRLDQALGGVEEPISPRLPAPPLSVERHLPEPIGSTDAIEDLAGGLAERLKPDLERRGEGAKAMELALFRVDGVVFRVKLALSQPLRDPKRLRLLFRERLAALEARLDAGFGFDLLRLSVIAAAPMPTEQKGFDGTARHDGEEIAALADRLRARLGVSVLWQPAPVASHLPERAARLVSYGEAPTAKTPTAKTEESLLRDMQRHPARPIFLFSPPEHVEAVAEVPDGPPFQFRWRRVLHRVARSEGPERIAPEWWMEDKTAPRPAERQKEAEEALPASIWIGPDTRDYFRVEDTEGRRYWLFRQGLFEHANLPQPRWFLHGLFA